MLISSPGSIKTRGRSVAIGFVASLVWMCSAALMQPAPAGAALATIQNIPPTPHRVQAVEDVPAAIKRALLENGWQVEEEKPGEITASTTVGGREQAVISIGYDASNFWIDYEDSSELDYSPDDGWNRGGRHGLKRRVKGPLIHEKYNAWVAALARQIEPEPEPVPVVAPTPPTESQPTHPVLVADELEKLDQLRQRGVLTQEEFDRAKARLLGL